MVEEVTVRAQLKDELTQPIRRVRDEMERTDKAAERLSSRRRRRDVLSMNRAFGGWTRTVSGLDRRMRGLSRTTGEFFGRQLRRGAITMAALTATVSFFGLQAASSFEQSQIAFEGLLGSQQKGVALFEELIEFNKRTPFELQNLTGAARQLLGFQFEERQVMPLVRATADITSALGAGAAGLDRIILNLGQVQAQGRVTGRELRDFATVGFPGYALVADILGVTREEVRALGDDAEVSADQFIDAVINMQGPLSGFQGMAERQQKSLMGLWSNIKDVFTVGMSDTLAPLIDQIAPLLDLETGALPRLLDATLAQIGPPLVDLLGLLLELGTQAMPLIGPVLAALATGVGDLVEAALPGMDLMVPVAHELSGAFLDLTDELAPLMPELVTAFVDLVRVLPQFVRLLGDLVPLVTPVVSLVGGLLELEPVRDVLAGLLVVLLGYRALSSVVGAVTAMTTALWGLQAAQVATAGTGAGAAVAAGGWGPVMAGGGKGKLAKLGMVGLGVSGAVTAVSGMGSEPTLGGDAKVIGGAAATGAGIGSFVPVVGTGLGAVAGGAFGVGFTGARRIGQAFGLGRDDPARRPVPTSGSVPTLHARPIVEDRSTSATFAPGSVQVYEPQTEMDVERAVRRVIEDYFDELNRRN